MKALINKIKRFIFNSPYRSSPLPVGVAEFDSWSNSIIEISGRFADEKSMKFALATMILHADANESHLPKMYFVQRLRKSAANQIANQVFHDIKTQQAEELKAQQEAADTAAKESAVTADAQTTE